MNKIIDTILYYDEVLMLDLRLNILNKYIDYFVILECNYDFNGNFKGYNFDINNFEKFKDKIIYKKLDLTEQIHLVKKNGWFVHDKSRDAIMDCLHFANSEDVIIHSDADEIPNLENFDLQNIKDKIYVFKQRMCYFKFNLQDRSIYWTKSKMCKLKLLKSFSSLRWLKGKKYNFYRVDTLFKKNHSLNVSIVENGGWHFSYIKNLEDIAKKLKSVVEKEHGNYSIEFIQSQIDKRINFLDRYLSPLTKENLDDGFPEYLVANKDKYLDFIV
jgi:beta-1,4-mannosyl-glycoprotein beta-1,4-N-acetylglucosaminyltransferase